MLYYIILYEYLNNKYEVNPLTVNQRVAGSSPAGGAYL